MGAVVQILGAANHTLTVFTNGSGHYSASGLLPGLYTLQVTAPSFLPALREKIGLTPGATLNINITLNTLLNVMQLGPIRALPDDDDWKWTLRSVANRPVLRALDEPRIEAASETPAENHGGMRDLKGTLSFLAGSTAGAYGTGSDMSTGFTLEHSIFADGLLNFSGNVGYGEGTPAAVLHTGYSNELADGSEPTMGLTVRRFASADPNLHDAALQALALSAGDDITFGDVLELKFGSELQAIQFLGHVTAFRPYASADIAFSRNTVLEYGYATSRPDLRAEKGFDSAPADMSETNPRISMLGYAPQVESAHHQELSLSRRLGKNAVQVAVFSDSMINPALTGTGLVTSASGFLLPDFSSGTFSYTGPNMRTQGLRVILERKFAGDLTATLDYAFGGVLELAGSDVQLENVQSSIAEQRRHAIAAKFSGTLPHSHTRWIASYRWVNGSAALTPVDMFNATPGQSDPFLNVFIRQPLPTLGFLPSHIEAIIDVRNLLAQGYIPVVGLDGQTVYLVQSARAVRGGIAFTF